MLVLDDHLVSSLVLLAGALEAVFGFVNRGINVLDRQTGPFKGPLRISTRVSIIGHAHDEGFASICHQVLVCSFDLWNSCREVFISFRWSFYSSFRKVLGTTS